MHKSTLREYTESVLIAAILALFIRTFVFQAFKIPTGSMEDHLLVGDHILVNKFIYGPTATRLEDWLLPVRAADRQDVMVFRAPQEPDKDFIKRVMGLPGENVVVEGGAVVIDGQAIDDPYANHKSVVGNNFHDTREPFDVPEGEYFAMGDNRENSRDSRYWGAVPVSHIKGKAMLVYWSYESGEQEYVGGVRERLMQFGNVMLHFFTRTRWGRTFKVIH